eukprot:11237451-Alexandrium_andersonii.AAC.1
MGGPSRKRGALLPSHHPAGPAQDHGGGPPMDVGHLSAREATLRSRRWGGPRDGPPVGGA